MSRCKNPFAGRCCPSLVAAGIVALAWGAAWPSSGPLPAYTPLHAAACAGDLDGLRELASGGRDGVDVRDALGETPLHYAAQSGRADVVRWLIDQGADPCARDCQGQTPLHNAAASYTGDGDAVAGELLSYYRSPDVTDDHRRTPLHAACRRGDIKLAMRLIAAGADVNARDDLGQTPLYKVGYQDKAELVEMLARAGADLGVRDNEGHTALSTLTARHSPRTVAALRRLGAAGG